MSQWTVLLMIGLAGAAGALARHGVGQMLRGAAFPLGTLLINVSGAFALGWFMTMVRGRWQLNDGWILAIATGFLGAYTTFSTYMFESDQLMQEGQWLRAAAYVAGSVFLGLVAVRLGVIAGR